MEFKPSLNQKCYMPSFYIGFYETMIWTDSARDRYLLKIGLIFKTRSGAVGATRKMIKTINPDFNE